ncbi:hypothetical protein [Streptomyces himalayensis]|uniref:Uncharacterized protein n=1 Tax=Streptomyces himalayensis subsp. himalayensis TaxID=2756131 RepID=A0A7W0DR97_9ACTN|nr:hypothetical protein [Streptomyces himalayensis]MBA2949812.1 hypothetical protein [Streptomyces himalayensis subsp. himalayensis]
MIYKRTRLRVGIASVAVAAATGFAGFQLAEADEFKKEVDRAEFCRQAMPLDLQNSDELTIHEKRHILGDLTDLAPEAARNDFYILLDWYDHYDSEDKEDAREASFDVGEFIELNCSNINIGGIRASRN